MELEVNRTLNFIPISTTPLEILRVTKSPTLLRGHIVTTLNDVVLSSREYLSNRGR